MLNKNSIENKISPELLLLIKTWPGPPILLDDGKIHYSNRKIKIMLNGKQETLTNTLAVGGSKKIYAISEGQVIALPNVSDLPPQRTQDNKDKFDEFAKNWQQLVEDEITLTACLRKDFGFYTQPYEYAELTFDDYVLPVIKSINFSTMANGGQFVFQGKSFSDFENSPAIFSTVDNFTALAYWKKLMDPICEEVAKMYRRSIKIEGDAINLLVCIDKTKPEQLPKLHLYFYDLASKHGAVTLKNYHCDWQEEDIKKYINAVIEDVLNAVSLQEAQLFLSDEKKNALNKFNKVRLLKERLDQVYDNIQAAVVEQIHHCIQKSSEIEQKQASYFSKCIMQ